MRSNQNNIDIQENIGIETALKSDKSFVREDGGRRSVIEHTSKRK